MAKRIIIECFDDLDGASVDIADLTTIEWSWNGIVYEFDTIADNLAEIETGRVPLATVLTNSRRIGGRKHSAGRSPSTSPHRPATGESNVNTAGIRTWARTQGYQLGDRGRISADIVAAYHRAAHTTS
jgi:hypothetical protein